MILHFIFRIIYFPNLIDMIRLLILFLLLNGLDSMAQKIQNLELVIPTGHTKTVNTTTFSPDGQYILTGGGKDRTAKLWEAKSGRMVYTLGGHQYGVWKALFSPDGQYILTASILEMKLWKAETGQLIDSFKLDVSKQQLRLFIEKFYFDGYQLHTYDDGGLHLTWGLHPFRAVYQAVDNISFSHQDSLLFPKNRTLPMTSIISDNKNSILYDVRQKHGIERSLQSPNKKYLMIATKDSLIQVWRLVDKKLFETIRLKGVAHSIRFSSEGKYALMMGLGASVMPFLLDTDNWQRSYLNYYHNLGWSQFSEDEQFLLIPSHQQVIMYNIETQEIYKTFNLKSSYAHTGIISPDNKYVLITSNNHEITVWSIETGNHLYTLGGHLAALEGAKASPNGDYLVTWVIPYMQQRYKNTKVWNIKTGTIKYSFPNLSMLKPQFSPNGQFLIVSDSLRAVKLLDLETGQKVMSFNKKEERLESAFFSKNGEYIIGSHEEGIKFWKTKANPWSLPTNQKILNVDKVLMNEKGTLLYTLSDNQQLQTWSFPQMERLDSFKINRANYIVLSPKDDYVAFSNGNEGIEVWDLKLRKQLYYVSAVEKIEDLKFSPDGKFIVSISRDNTGAIIRAKNGKIVKILAGHSGWLSCMDIHPNKKIIATGSSDNTIKLWALKNGKLLKTLSGHVSEIKSVEFSASDNQLISSSLDGTCKIWQLSGKEIGTLIGIKNHEHICITANNYFLGTKEAVEILNWKQGLKLYNFQQFDLKFNRPDMVLKQLGQSNMGLIEAYLNAYKTRLSKMRFKESDFVSEINLPEVAIITDASSISTTNPMTNILIKASGNQKFLNSIHVWINDIPLYGIKGIDLTHQKIKNWEQMIPLTLSKGKNKIEVSALNQAGLESLKKTIYMNLDYLGENKSDLYIVAIGTEKFKNPDQKLELQYPIKGLRDFIKVYQNRKDEYQNIIVDSLYNMEVSFSALLAIKEKLKNSKIDDQVILFVAGHGVFDNNLDYYFAAPNTDFNNPSNGGILYEDLENLLDGIPARQKLFLIDACHSGEIDKDETKLVEQEMNKSQDIIFRSFGKTPKVKNLGLENSFELMKQLFVDLRRGTGATVISSAAGGEFARESKKWNNSVFTYCLLSGLTENKENSTSKKADLNEDGQIMVSELQQYLAAEVPKLTKGHQQPTMRVENISNDWRVW